MPEIIVIAIMVMAGAFGGYLAYLLERDRDARLSSGQDRRRDAAWPTFILTGIGAALLIPLFLKLTDSQLQQNVMSEDHIQSKDLFVFASLCLLASLSSRTFMSSLAKKALNLAEEAKSAGDQATANAEQAMVAAEELSKSALQARTDLQAAIDEAKKLSSTDRILKLAQATKDEIPISSIKSEERDLWNQDPHKGKFGGMSISNNRQIQARLGKRGSDGLYSVELAVTSTDPIGHPLIDPVTFFYHPTVRPRKEVIQPVDGVADTELELAGAFTVGAETDRGQTKLELDLSTIPGAPQDFIDN